MAKKRNTGIIIIVAVVILAVAFLLPKGGLFTVIGTETMTRTSSASVVAPGATFTLTYTAVGTNGTWGASIIDAVSGGCKFPDGTASYKSVMLSADGASKTVTITAPSTAGNCTFTGDYKYGDFAIKTFPSLNVKICAKSCTTRPTNLCLASSSDGCGGTCTWTVTKNTNADTNCDNVVSRDELGSFITSWTAGTVTRDDLGKAIQAWSAA